MSASFSLAFAVTFSAAAAVHGASDTLGWKAANDGVDACFAALDADPAFGKVDKHFARHDPSAAQLADTGVPSETESAALRKLMVKMRPCRAKRAALIFAYPELASSTMIFEFQTDEIFRYLSQRWITYGEANRLSKISLSDFHAREKAYFAAPREKQLALSKAWGDAFEHVPFRRPPERAPAACEWIDLALACR